VPASMRRPHNSGFGLQKRLAAGYFHEAHPSACTAFKQSSIVIETPGCRAYSYRNRCNADCNPTISRTSTVLPHKWIHLDAFKYFTTLSMASLKIGGGISRRFRYRDPDHPHFPVLSKALIFLKIYRAMFSEEGFCLMGRNKVQVRMVKSLMTSARAFSGTGIDPDAQFVELAAMDEHLHRQLWPWTFRRGRHNLLDDGRGEIGFG